MIWPPQSPDLNHIELIWNEIARKISHQCSTFREELWNMLQVEWQNIPPEIESKLIHTMSPESYELYQTLRAPSSTRRKCNYLIGICVRIYVLFVFSVSLLFIYVCNKHLIMSICISLVLFGFCEFSFCHNFHGRHCI